MNGTRRNITNDSVIYSDCVGLWVCDHPTKMAFLQDVDCVQAYDIEHIVSNSYGADNSDPNNGVLLDSRVNRTKVSRCFFTISGDIEI